MADSHAMETLSHATSRLERAGYVESYIARDGRLVCGRCGASYDPAGMSIEEIVRFEGDSDPADEAIVYALDSGCGHRGLYVAAYGPSASNDDITVAARLRSTPAP